MERPLDNCVCVERPLDKSVCVCVCGKAIG